MHDTFLNQAETFLLGLLEHSEEKQFLAHLASGCVECNKAVAAMSRVMRALPFALDSQIVVANPPASLKDRLLRSIKNADPKLSFPETPAVHAGSRQRAADEKKFVGPQVWKTWKDKPESAKSALPGLFTIGADEGEWEDVGISGIKVKRLFVDPERDSVTMLVRMPAGAAYPRHRHAAPEQCYVLAGDLYLGDIALHAGDYQCAAPNSIHGVQHTKAGCLLLIVSSLHDELIEANEA
jgi:quercetin dioxygenase-like cupin family protein